eukprot:12922092-Prorocentrum_lima.AAC.1
MASRLACCSQCCCSHAIFKRLPAAPSHVAWKPHLLVAQLVEVWQRVDTQLSLAQLVCARLGSARLRSAWLG